MYGQIKWNPQASTTVQPTEGPDWKSEEIGCSGQTGRMRKPDFEKIGCSGQDRKNAEARI